MGKARTFHVIRLCVVSRAVPEDSRVGGTLPGQHHVIARNYAGLDFEPAVTSHEICRYLRRSIDVSQHFTAFLFHWLK
jgi:hypothetical protein